MKSFKCLCVAVTMVVFFIGCATVSRKPDWVMKGSAAFKGNKKTIYGVGVAEGIKSEALRRSTADNRAIAEISRQLSVMSTFLMRDYMSSANATEQERSSGEQYVEQTVKTFASNIISGVKIIDRWDDGKTAYSLAALSIDDLKAMTDNIKELSQQMKEYIKQNAEKAFEKLEIEQQKRER